ncbi:hypothetical protein AMTRI_Chr07g78900 [Amborella trichopoda]|uniref:Uncharacterized protein n=1 Tax=Amborella trichopoda TaxID=13333 RepID=W1NLP7_AMBTC|nr:hypothetical protein AMTR_s00201p00035840 [Amborella trichopoda]
MKGTSEFFHPHPSSLATSISDEPEGTSELGSRLKPIATSQSAEATEGGCTTPTSEEHKIPSTLSCPPAPRKPRARKRKNVVVARFFFMKPHEIESIFHPICILSLRRKSRSRCGDE